MTGIRVRAQTLLRRNISMVVATVVLRKPQSAAAKDGPLTVSGAMAVFGVVMTFGLHRDSGAAAGVKMS